MPIKHSRKSPKHKSPKRKSRKHKSPKHKSHSKKASRRRSRSPSIKVSLVSKFFSEPSKSHLHKVIDTSHYFVRLNNVDLKARSAISQAVYMKKYKSRLMSFTRDESKYLNKIIRELNNNYLYKYKNLYKIPWIIVKFKGIEENYPHTLGNIIFLPEIFFSYDVENQMETLLHEKIHVYQRSYPIEISELIKSLGFEIFNSQSNIPSIRSNPDTDEFVYKLNNTIQVSQFPNENPSSIKEARIEILEGDQPWDFGPTVSNPEHPYEITAYILSHIILGKLNMDHKIIKYWMRVNL